MVGVMEISHSEQGVNMEEVEPSQRQIKLQKLHEMAVTLHNETALMTTEIVGKPKLNYEEVELLRQLGNVIFMTLNQTGLSQLSKRLQKILSIHDVMQMQFPLQIKVTEFKKATKKKLGEVKRLKKKPFSKDPDKTTNQVGPGGE